MAFMNPGMMTNDGNTLQQEQQKALVKQPPALKIPATLISYLFHPVFVPVYVIGFLVYIHPYLFAGFTDLQKLNTVAMAVVSFTFFPLVTVLLLKALKFIDTIYLRTQKDRVIPFIACMIWYFWIWYVWNNFGKTRDVIDMPAPAVQFALAAFISTIIGLMVNTRMKISLHAISAGIALMFFLLLAFSQDLHFGVWLALVILLTGLICTARLIVSDHTVQEVYAGLLTGIVSMSIAWWTG